MKNNVQSIWSDLHEELHKFIKAKLGNSTDSDDILQDVFVKIHLNIHQLKDASKLTAWVYQITRNTLADHQKQVRFTIAPDSIMLAENADDEKLYQSLSNCINTKIARLPEQGLQAVLLTYFKNYSQKDLAEFLGISYSGAKNRVQRAREQLKQWVLDCENVETDPSGKITDFNEKNIF